MKNIAKVVLITGASEGIGRGLAIRFARENWAIALLARDEKKLKLTADIISGHAAEFLVLPADVTNLEEVNRAVNKVIDGFGKIDVLINNVGAVVFGEVADCPREMAHKAMDVNFWGAVQMTQAVYPHMKERGEGHIINISSTAGFQAFPGNGFYCAAKHALNGLTGSLRFEAQKDGIDVTLICPDASTTGLVKNAYNAGPKQKSIVHEGMAPEYVADQIFLETKKKRGRVVIGLKGYIIYWLGVVAPKLVERLLGEKPSKENNGAEN